ncbi:MAG: ECF-type sigma factor [Acidobacteriota bacterium]
MTPSTGEVTELLQAWSDGDRDALDRIVPLVMDEVRQLARKALSLESRDVTIQPTELVNEAYLRLVDRKTFHWQDRVQFFSCLAELMRRILVDRARRYLAAKRGAGAARLSLEEGVFADPGIHPDWLRLDDALADLQKIDERRYRIVMLWFFVGMTQKEIADELGISVNTVARQWQSARRWLYAQLDASDQDGRDGG